MRDSLEQRKPQLRKHSAIRDFHPTISYYASAEVDPLLAELAQLRARVAILDAQEAKLPPMDYGLAAQEQCDSRERQLLDALRAIQVWREVAQQQNEALKFLAQEADGEISPATFEFANSAAAAYDALAGKGE